MRVRIVFASDMSELGLQTVLQRHDWNPVRHNQDSESESVRDRILDTVALEHRLQAQHGALYVLNEGRRNITGLVSKEADKYVIRITGDNIVVLQKITEKMVDFLIDFAKRNNWLIDFTVVEILEIRNRNVVSDGTVFKKWQERFKAAKQQKPVEYTVFIIAFVTVGVLLAITFRFRDISSIAQNYELKWAVDTAGKLIGSAAITTISAGLNFLFFYRSLKQVNWEYPEPEASSVSTD